MTDPVPYFPVIRRSTYHGYVPQTNAFHARFAKHVLAGADERKKRRNAAHEPAVQKFSDALSDEQKTLFETAVRQVGQYYAKWADTKFIIRSFDHFLTILDFIITHAPEFYKTQVHGVTIGEPVGVPLLLLLDLISNTTAAATLFAQPSFNAALKDLLNAWGDFLINDEKSSETLTEEQWWSDAALVILESGLGGAKFDDVFALTAPKPKRFNTWDQFFTRHFKDVTKSRPVVKGPYLYNACESTVLRTIKDIQLHDTFWLKTQNYSLFDVFGGNDPKSTVAQYAEKFIGASVYQAFLSPADYHRWHSPVDGDIVASQVLEGTYYAVLPDEGAPFWDTDLVPGDPHGALIRSQPWLSVVATRAVYVIKPSDEQSPIDWIGFIGIGMAEVSTCQITKPSGKVNIGDEIGTFRFGGSTHLQIVKMKDTHEVIFQDYYDTPIRPGQHRWINSVIGQLRPKTGPFSDSE